MTTSSYVLLLVSLLANENASLKWIELTSSADWPIRSCFGSVVDKDKNLIITGGRNATSVWKSEPNSNQIVQNWTLLQQYQLNTTTESYRQGFPTLVTIDNQQQQTIISLGGCDPNYVPFNDVWTSIDGGINWKQVNPSAPWATRCYLKGVVYGNNILIMGGYEKPGTVNYHNDVWSSSNNGVDWIQLTANAQWNGRDAFGAVVVNDSVIFIFGGHDGSGKPSQWHNDVWKSIDGGKNWLLVTEHADWIGRRGFVTGVWRNNIILMGGQGANNTAFNDMWISQDGALWKEISADNVWPARQWFAGNVVNDYVYVLGGDSSPLGPSFLNDVWMLDLYNYTYKI